jgi:hypothetical protein
MRRIDSKTELEELARELGVTSEWHGNDRIGVTAVVRGRVFDNAGFWPGYGGNPVPLEIAEKHVVIQKHGHDVAAVNLATLFAWATGLEN